MQDLVSDQRRSRGLTRVREIVEARGTRFALALLIIVSLLPYPAIEQTLRPLFLVVFATEIAARLVLLVTRETRRASRDVAFFALDFAALLSFLPFEALAQGTPWLATVLTLLRLSRLLVLLRFGRELALDVYSILTRREQLQQFALVTAAVAGLAFVSAVFLVQLDVDHPYDGGAHGDGHWHNPDTFWDRAWWAFRQLESADNLVSTVRQVHPVIALLSLALTVTGVFIISFLIGLGTNVVEQVVRAERRRPVDYKHHSLVTGCVDESEVLVREFVRLYDKNRSLRTVTLGDLYRWLFKNGPEPRRHALPRMALLGTTSEPPAYLLEPGMRWVVYREGDAADQIALSRVGAKDAKRMLLLSRKDAGYDTDAVTIATLTSFREVNRDAHVFVEAMSSQNVSLLASAGGPGTFPLDVPRFLGLFLCHHLVVPGVEHLYRDLLTASGCEFYTHLFVDREEHDSLARFGGEHLSFSAMAREAYRRHGVILTGVFLSDAPISRLASDLIPVDRLSAWINPESESPGPEHVALGAKPGEVPMATLRGLIGISENYAPLRSYARSLLARQGTEVSGEVHAEMAKGAERIAAVLKGDYRPLRRVLILGFSPALASLVRSLASFVPGVHAVVVIATRKDSRTSLDERIAALELGLDREPGDRGVDVALEKGGTATVYTYQGRDSVAFAMSRLASEKPIDAAVFMSDPESVDADARTQLRMLRFAKALAEGRVPRAPRLHVLAEVMAEQRSEGLRRLFRASTCGFESEDALRLTLVSTERIKNYFLVHSAFVPGVTDLYDRLLGARGQEIVRLAVTEPLPVETSFAELTAALRLKQCIPIAVEHMDGTVELNPPKTRVLRGDAIRSVYAIADTDTTPGLFGRASELS